MMDAHGHIEFPTTSGVVLRGNSVGTADAGIVLLLHGGGQTRETWRSSAQTLADHGWQAIYLDLRGHGESDWSKEGDYRSTSIAEDISDVVRQLGNRPAIVGASMGGLAALSAIKLYGHSICSALALVDVAPQVDPNGAKRILDFMSAAPNGFKDMEEVLEAVSRYNPNRVYTKEGLIKNVRKNECGRYIWHWDPKLISGDQRATVDQHHFEVAARELDRLRLPTLLVRGRTSDLLTVEGAKHFLSLVPDAAFADIEGAGHMVVGDKNDLFTDALIDFLETVRSLA